MNFISSNACKIDKGCCVTAHSDGAMLHVYYTAGGIAKGATVNFLSTPPTVALTGRHAYARQITPIGTGKLRLHGNVVTRI